MAAAIAIVPLWVALLLAAVFVVDASRGRAWLMVVGSVATVTIVLKAVWGTATVTAWSTSKRIGLAVTSSGGALAVVVWLLGPTTAEWRRAGLVWLACSLGFALGEVSRARKARTAPLS